MQLLQQQALLLWLLLCMLLRMLLCMLLRERGVVRSVVVRIPLHPLQLLHVLSLILRLLARV